MFSILTTLVAFAATAVAYNEIGPFAIRITGKTNSSIDGYAMACHSAVINEGLCYGPGKGQVPTSNEFYYNYTQLDSTTGEPVQPGTITWILRITSPDNTTEDHPSSVAMFLSGVTNVAVLQFSFGTEGGMQIYYHAENGMLHLPAGSVDDSKLTETEPHPRPEQGELTNWHVCYQYTGFYYHHSIAWVTSLPPQNPTCQPVDLKMEALPS